MISKTSQVESLIEAQSALGDLLRQTPEEQRRAGYYHTLREICHQPQTRHLILTCNAGGRIATSYAGDPRVTVLALDDATNDRSLVMTSSFTNLVIAGRILGMLDRPAAYRNLVDGLSRAADLILLR